MENALMQIAPIAVAIGLILHYIFRMSIGKSMIIVALLITVLFAGGWSILLGIIHSIL